MSTILILSPTGDNASAIFLATALQSKAPSIKVIVTNVGDFGPALLEDTSISLVINRSGSSHRHQAVDICEQFHKKGIRILNGIDFIRWNNEKIAQYRDLEARAIFPVSFIFDREYVKHFTESYDFSEIINKAKTLGFPLIFKTNEGAQASGVFKVESIMGLQSLLEYLVKKMRAELNNDFSSGFLLQKFITTHTNPNISEYYRIDIVDGKIQCAMLRSYGWDTKSSEQYKALDRSAMLNEKPIPNTFFTPAFIQKITKINDFKMDMIGVDVVKDTEGNFYVLEYNASPGIARAVYIGEHSPASNETKACREFPLAIADCCLSYVNNAKPAQPGSSNDLAPC